MTEKLQEFLIKFDDQHLANLQCAAEDGRLVYRDGCNCLVHHFAGEYTVTKWDPELGPLARAAEQEFFKLGGECEMVMGSPLLCATIAGDPRRRAAILPMIYGEWARRAKEVVPAQTTPVELTPCSPAIR